MMCVEQLYYELMAKGLWYCYQKALEEQQKKFMF